MKLKQTGIKIPVFIFFHSKLNLEFNLYIFLEYFDIMNYNLSNKKSKSIVNLKFGYNTA